MSKRGTIRKFGRERDQRAALIKSLATALVEHGRITTTEAKAKTLAPAVSKLVTLAKKQTLAARREALKSLGLKATDKLMKDVAPRFQGRNGGYTRIIRLDQRRSDGSAMAIVEFVN